MGYQCLALNGFLVKIDKKKLEKLRHMVSITLNGVLFKEINDNGFELLHS